MSLALATKGMVPFLKFTSPTPTYFLEMAVDVKLMCLSVAIEVGDLLIDK